MKNPEIRFINDNIDWQNKKIEDILEPYVEKNTNNYPSVAIGRYGIRRREEIYSKELSKDTTKNKVINKNTLTVGMGSTQIDIGILHTDEHLSVSPAYHTFNILDNDSKFIENSFAKNNEKYSKQHMIIGARQGKSVDFPNFLADTIYLPPMKVQREIASLLTDIEDKITKQENLIQKLKDTKSALLIKMFPQENQSIPELRFDGFTNDWEQRKVDDILVERNEQYPQNDKYPLMAFIANIGVAPKGEKYDRSALVNDVENKSYKRTEYGDFIYSSNNLETGSIGLNKYGKATISPVYSIFKPTEIADSDFIGKLLVRKTFINEMIKWRQGVIYGQWKIHESDFLKIKIDIPSIQEQKQIGFLFDKIDNLITLHQRKLDKLKEVKSALLDKLLV